MNSGTSMACLTGDDEESLGRSVGTEPKECCALARACVSGLKRIQNRFKTESKHVDWKRTCLTGDDGSVCMELNAEGGDGGCTLSASFGCCSD
jgi:hypothetical protein